MNDILGRLEKVDLRDIWENEVTSFTPWLAREENLQLLSEKVGRELELEAQEKSVGPFSADILCKDVATDHWVLIENQLEKRLVALTFNIVSKPNDWTKTVAQGAKRLEQDALKLQEKFWIELKAWAEQHQAPFKMMKPSAQHWTNVSLGKSGFKLALILNMRLNEIRVELYITRPQAKPYFRALEAQKTAIETELGEALT